MKGKLAMGVGPLAVECRGMSVNPGASIKIRFQVKNNGGTNWPAQSVIWVVVLGTSYSWAFTTNAVWPPGTVSAVTETPYFAVPSGWAGTSKNVNVAVWDPTETTEYGSDYCTSLILVGAGAASAEVLLIEAAG